MMLLLSFAITAFQLVFGAPIATAKSAYIPEKRTGEIFTLAAQTHQPTGAQVTEAQRERAPPLEKIALGVLLGTETNLTSVRPDFYITPGGTAIPATGYRYISSDVSYLNDLASNGQIPANPKGTYFSFAQIDDPSMASGLLQVPHNAAIRMNSIPCNSTAICKFREASGTPQTT
jgi:hypothetical protein